MYYVYEPKENQNITEEVKTEELSVEIERLDTDNVDIKPIKSWIDEWDNVHGDLILF